MRAFESVGSTALRTALIGRACKRYWGCATQAGDEDLELVVVLKDARKSGHQTGRSRVSSATEEVFDHRFALVQRPVTVLSQPTIVGGQAYSFSRVDDAPAVGWSRQVEGSPSLHETESGVVIRAAADRSSEVLVAFLVDCHCGTRLLVGDALGDTHEEESAAWRATLTEVARRLAIPLLWGGERARCPGCGTPVSRSSAARR